MLGASLLVHVVLLGVLFVGPQFAARPEMPQAVTVDLLAAPGPPPAPRKPAAKPAPAKPAPAPEKPPPPAKAEPIPPPPPAKAVPPPPPTEAKVLPKEAVKTPEKAKPAPPPPKPAPPAPAEKPAPPKPVKQASIDDVLKELREAAGEEAPEAVVEEAPVDLPEAFDVAGTGGGGGSVKVSPEVMAWLKSARIHVRKGWVLAPGLKLQPLLAEVQVELDAGGNVMGEPTITRRSGNPWYDDSVVRAIQKASPLPPPPRAGSWKFVFRPQEG